jgi:hypothetical protein
VFGNFDPRWFTASKTSWRNVRDEPLMRLQSLSFASALGGRQEPDPPALRAASASASMVFAPQRERINPERDKAGDRDDIASSDQMK